MDLSLPPPAARLSQSCARTWVSGEVLAGLVLTRVPGFGKLSDEFLFGRPVTCFHGGIVKFQMALLSPPSLLTAN